MTDEGPSPLDTAYFEWLYSLIGSSQNRNPARNHRSLLTQFYFTPFFGHVPNDDNRSADGKDLRIEFLQSTGFPLDDPYGQWFDLECSMFEMLIALGRRVSFEDEYQGSQVEWFWRLVHNLELDKYTDDIFEISIQEEVEEVLSRVNQRTYAYSGLGGLFPLRDARYDQRKVELWTQMSAYLLEGAYAGNRPSW